MKKICLAGILSILFVGISFAQTRIGITAGLNVSNVTGSDVEDSKFKAGFQAGLVADFGITPNFSIMPELLFGQRGFKVETKEGGVSGSFTTTLNYIQLPINAAYKFDVGYGAKFFIFAGPYLGYGVSASAKATGKAEGVEITIPVDEIKFGSKDDELKPFDFGINAGIGFEYEKIFFKLQCNPGLSNMLNNSGDYTMKNMNVAVSAGYFFN